MSHSELLHLYLLGFVLTFINELRLQLALQNYYESRFLWWLFLFVGAAAWPIYAGLCMLMNCCHLMDDYNATTEMLTTRRKYYHHKPGQAKPDLREEE